MLTGIVQLIFEIRFEQHVEKCLPTEKRRFRRIPPFNYRDDTFIRGIATLAC